MLASDTERLQDVDTDDTASVARSDDTARSEVDSEPAQNVDDGQPDRKDPLDPDNMQGTFFIMTCEKQFFFHKLNILVRD